MILVGGLLVMATLGNAVYPAEERRPPGAETTRASCAHQAKKVRPPSMDEIITSLTEHLTTCATTNFNNPKNDSTFRTIKTDVRSILDKSFDPALEKIEGNKEAEKRFLTGSYLLLEQALQAFAFQSLMEEETDIFLHKTEPEILKSYQSNVPVQFLRWIILFIYKRQLLLVKKYTPDMQIPQLPPGTTTLYGTEGWPPASTGHVISLRQYIYNHKNKISRRINHEVEASATRYLEFLSADLNHLHGSIIREKETRGRHDSSDT